MKIDDWKTQIKRGILEYCILILLSKKDSYGYEIMNELSKYPMVATKESTTYPLLRRLEKGGFTTSFWKDAAEGLPPRKYYSITDLGRKFLMDMSLEWDTLVNTISDIKEKDDE